MCLYEFIKQLEENVNSYVEQPSFSNQQDAVTQYPISEEAIDYINETLEAGKIDQIDDLIRVLWLFNSKEDIHFLNNGSLEVLFELMNSKFYRDIKDRITPFLLYVLSIDEVLLTQTNVEFQLESMRDAEENDANHQPSVPESQCPVLTKNLEELEMEGLFNMDVDRVLQPNGQDSFSVESSTSGLSSPFFQQQRTPSFFSNSPRLEDASPYCGLYKNSPVSRNQSVYPCMFEVIKMTELELKEQRLKNEAPKIPFKSWWN